MVLDVEKVLLLRILFVLRDHVRKGLDPCAVSGIRAVLVQFQDEARPVAHDFVHIREDEGVRPAREVRRDTEGKGSFVLLTNRAALRIL